MAFWGVIALLAISCQPKTIDRSAEAVVWYKEFQQGRGDESACLSATVLDPPAIAGAFQVKSTRLEPMEVNDKLTVFRHENILTDGTANIYVYGWKTEEFALYERSLYEMLGAEPHSSADMSQLEQCLVFSPEAL